MTIRTTIEYEGFDDQRIGAAVFGRLHAEDIAEPYLDAYCNIANMPRASILDWLPFVAAARLAEDVPDDWPRLLEIVHA